MALQRAGRGVARRSLGERLRQSVSRPVAIFTGIVQSTAEVSREAGSVASGLRSLEVRFPERALDGCEAGGSIALNGCCLTATAVNPHDSVAKFDVISETLRCTNLGDLSVGDCINFERSARVGDEVGGHLVSGHIHGVATLSDTQDAGEGSVRWVLSPDPALMRYILPKGYIALDGASLTVGKTGDDWFSVYLIPETMRMTTFGSLQVGTKLNVEIDMQTQAMVDTVERYMEARQR